MRNKIPRLYRLKECSVCHQERAESEFASNSDICQICHNLGHRARPDYDGATGEKNIRRAGKKYVVRIRKGKSRVVFRESFDTLEDAVRSRNEYKGG